MAEVPVVLSFKPEFETVWTQLLETSSRNRTAKVVFSMGKSGSSDLFSAKLIVEQVARDGKEYTNVICFNYNEALFFLSLDLSYDMDSMVNEAPDGKNIRRLDIQLEKHRQSTYIVFRQKRGDKRAARLSLYPREEYEVKMLLKKAIMDFEQKVAEKRIA